MRKLTFLLACLLLVGIGLVNAQSKSISGKVVSADDGQPVIGATVKVKGAKTGTVTGVNGDFSISVESGSLLVVSYVGMKTTEVAAKSNMTVSLQQDSRMIDEVVVTAMGIKRSEKTLGYSATAVKSSELTTSRNNNLTNSLAGKVAGLQIQSTSGDPGSDNSVVIRGFSSINGSNNPLYVVDGVPLQNTSVQTSGHSVAAGGVANVAPDDIESMTILKGAAATALYGSRAANGVIVITTKQGKAGDGKNFTVEYNGGIQARRLYMLPEMQNQFGQGWNGKQTFIENGSWGARLDGSDQVYGPIWNNQQRIHEYSAKENNIRDFFDTGWMYNNQIALNGISSDKKMTYYVSYSNTKDNGIMPSDYDVYKRNIIAARSSFEPTNFIKLSTSFNFARTNTDIVGSYQGTSVIDGLYEIPRDISIVDMKDLSNAFNTPEAYLTPYGITNPYWALANNYNHMDSKQIYGKVQADIKLCKKLNLTYRFGFDYTDYDRKVGSPEIELDDALITNNMGYAPKNMNQSGSVYAAYRRSYEINHDFLMNYDDKFSDFTVTANLGTNINERYRTTLTAQTDVLTFNTGYWDLSNGSTKSVLEEAQYKRRLIGVLGDATLGYKDMLFLNVSARNDWSSTLPANKNNFFYSGATLSWLFTENIQKNDILSLGKMRLAYGKTGNDAEPYYTSTGYDQAYANGYYGNDIAKFPINGTNAFIASTRAGSTNLTPEMTTEVELGLNLQFFNGRLGLDAAYYDRKTNDQIFELPIDPATGYSSMVTNFGKVQNKGIELLLNTTPIKTKKFRWDLNFNFAINRNKVLSLPASLEGGKVQIYNFKAGNDAVYMYAEQGKPMGRFYTYLPQRVTDKNSKYYGSLIVDSNGQPVIGSEVEDTGYDINHKWTGGVTTSLSAYGFTLSASLDVRYGGYMFSRTKNLMQFTGNSIITTYNNRNPFIIPNSVVATTGADGKTSYSENTTAVRMTDGSMQEYYDKKGYAQGGLAYLVDKSFVKLRNITLSYTLPKRFAKAIYMSDISVSAFANNLFTWTAADNYFIDPESSTVGNDLSGQFGELYVNPSNRVYGFNLNVKF